MKIIDKAYTFFELHSHLKGSPDAYKIAFYSFLANNKNDILSPKFYLTTNK